MFYNRASCKGVSLPLGRAPFAAQPWATNRSPAKAKFDRGHRQHLKHKNMWVELQHLCLLNDSQYYIEDLPRSASTTPFSPRTPNCPTALLGSCASGKCRFNASRSLSAWPQRIQAVDVWLAFGWLRWFLKIAMGQPPKESTFGEQTNQNNETMQIQCKQHEKPLLKNNPKPLHEQLAQLTKRYEDQTDRQSTQPTNQQNNQPASHLTYQPTTNDQVSLTANRPTTPTSNPRPLTTGCQGSNFPGRVNDSHEDPWNFWWHVTGAQETMDAPGVSIPSLFLIYNILILRSLQATLGSLSQKHSKAKKKKNCLSWSCHGVSLGLPGCDAKRIRPIECHRRPRVDPPYCK